MLASPLPLCLTYHPSGYPRTWLRQPGNQSIQQRFFNPLPVFWIYIQQTHVKYADSLIAEQLLTILLSHFCYPSRLFETLALGCTFQFSLISTPNPTLSSTSVYSIHMQPAKDNGMIKSSTSKLSVSTTLCRTSILSCSASDLEPVEPPCVSKLLPPVWFSNNPLGLLPRPSSTFSLYIYTLLCPPHPFHINVNRNSCVLLLQRQPSNFSIHLVFYSFLRF